MEEAVEAGGVRSIGLSSSSATLVRKNLDWAARARPGYGPILYEELARP